MLNQITHSNYQVTHCELLAKDISRVFLQASANHCISYQAGQYIKILHPDQSISPMSIACAPHDIKTMELHLHHPAENNQAIELLQLITSERQLSMQGPYGSCTAKKIDLNYPLIFMAACTGFAPIKAIMEELVTIKHLPEINFYWSGVHASELYMRDLVQDWQVNLKQFNVIPVISEPVIPVILRDFADLSGHQVYAVDMEDTVYQALSAFIGLGLSKQRFYSDVLDYSLTN